MYTSLCAIRSWNWNWKLTQDNFLIEHWIQRTHRCSAVRCWPWGIYSSWLASRDLGTTRSSYLAWVGPVLIMFYTIDCDVINAEPMCEDRIYIFSRGLIASCETQCMYCHKELFIHSFVCSCFSYILITIYFYVFDKSSRWCESREMWINTCIRIRHEKPWRRRSLGMIVCLVVAIDERPTKMVI